MGVEEGNDDGGKGNGDGNGDSNGRHDGGNSDANRRRSGEQQRDGDGSNEIIDDNSNYRGQKTQ